MIRSPSNHSHHTAGEPSNGAVPNTGMAEASDNSASIISPGNRSFSGSHPPGHALRSSPSGHSLTGAPSGTQAFVQPTEAAVIEKQLPSFMKIDEAEFEKARHPQRRRDILRRRLELKNNAVAAVSEFCGTFLFLFFSFVIATQAANGRAASQNNNVDQGTQSLSQNAPPDTSSLLYSSLGFGFSLAVNAWTFYRVSGGLFNPAVTLALTLTKVLNWKQCISLTISQIIGGIAAAAVCDAIIPGPINARTSLSSGISVAQGFWLEFFLTAQLIFAVFMLAKEKHRGTFLAPVGIGLSLFISEILNPARSFGPDVVLGRFDSYHWIYWIAPYAAAIFTSGFYILLKYVQYESVNEGQDSDESKQVLRDASGTIVGVLDSVPTHEFHYINEATVEQGQAPNAVTDNARSSFGARSAGEPVERIRSRSEHGNSTLGGHGSFSPIKREFDSEHAARMA
ncbi:uncharacterized protein PFL1_01910 [Pseudozyma flocculosa PF-1]|uniref:uncharacterized protein n=1 Tax=Pseudozyma flocculosa PF-1 TaxID=1277687 RepID=UPI0004561123|nr:uncharacterized protein PFL1_01910 [Pseudozyma flocculosa PF-1]EPQ30384.1 hypothetical protein PFL1_01910 [Pseudozyma flocculosa PF-1]